jgi:hypothetical protein
MKTKAFFAIILCFATLFSWRFAQAQTVYIGNRLTDPAITNGAADNGKPFVILGEYNPAGVPLATATPSTTLRIGAVQDVKFYGKNYNFTLYSLAYFGPGPDTDVVFQVVASLHFSGTNSVAGTNTLPVTNFPVYAGELLAFAGQGPYYPQTSNDATNSDATYEDSTNPGSNIATPPGGVGTVFSVAPYADTNGTYGYISDVHGNQGRTYGIGVDVSETNLFLPVYQVTQAGTTFAQATNLANLLNIPSNMLGYSNGVVFFIDPSNWMTIPTVAVTNAAVISNLLAVTKNPYPAIPISFRAINFAALTNLPVYSANAALSSASNALAASGLTPQLGIPVIGHTVVTAFMTNADNSVSSAHQYLDTQVNYQFFLPNGTNGYPLIGAGAQAQLDYGPTGKITRVFYTAPRLTAGPLVQIISPTEASNRIAVLLPANAQVRAQLVYWSPSRLPPLPGPPCYECPPPPWNPTNIIPWYAFNGTINVTNPVTGSNISVTTATQFIPATDDTNFVPSLSLSASGVGNTQIVASVSVSGGTPPYTYIWSGSSPAVSTNTSASISYTPMARISPPPLAIAYAGSGTHTTDVMWPYPSTGFILESTTNLAAGNWSQVSSTVETNTGVNLVTLPITRNNLFLRLRLANQILVTETVGVTVTDANGVGVQTNQSFAVLAEPFPVSAGDPPITYGCESPYDPHMCTPYRQSWQAVMGNPFLGGGSQRFCWTGYLSWPGDFIEPPVPGTLLNEQTPPGPAVFGDADFLNWGINTATIVLYTGHSDTAKLSFTYPDPYTDGAYWDSWLGDGLPGGWPGGTGGTIVALGQEPPGGWITAAGTQPSQVRYANPPVLTHSWGPLGGPNDNLLWLCTYSCKVLTYNGGLGEDFDSSPPSASSGPYAWQRWGPAFNGLHILLGWHNYADFPPAPYFPGDFAANMLGLNIFNIPLIQPQTILQAWTGAALTDVGGAIPAAMGPLGPGGVCDSGDYYSGKGSMGLTIPPPSTPPSPFQRTGWWYVNTQTGMIEVP